MPTHQELKMHLFIDSFTLGTLVKSGSGSLSRVCVGRGSPIRLPNNKCCSTVTINIYDGLSAVNQIARIELKDVDTIYPEYNIEFTTGLFVVISGTGKIGTTIIYT
jgi:hypothetical protein